MRRLRLLWDLARKDWSLFLADRRAALLCFLVPILLASAFGIIFDRPGQRMGQTRLPMLIVVEDAHPFTLGVVSDLCAGAHVEAQVTDLETAERALSDRKIGVAIVFPAGFGAQALDSKLAVRPTVRILHHPLSALESQWAEGVLTEAVMKRTAQAYLAPLGLQANAIQRPFALERHGIPNDTDHPFNSYSHSFCGMTLQYLLFWGMESGLLLLRERQRGIWTRLSALPAPLTMILLGRALATGMIALLQVAVTFAFGYVVFGVTITGSWFGFIAMTLAVCALSAALGLFVAAVGGTESRARNLFIVVILAVSMLGGLWLPAFLLPGWVRDAGLGLPTTWAIRGLDGATWQGRSFVAILPCVIAVGLFTLLFLGVALGRFLWSESLRRRGVLS